MMGAGVVKSSRSNITVKTPREKTTFVDATSTSDAVIIESLDSSHSLKAAEATCNDIKRQGKLRNSSNRTSNGFVNGETESNSLQGGDKVSNIVSDNHINNYDHRDRISSHDHRDQRVLPKRHAHAWRSADKKLTEHQQEFHVFNSGNAYLIHKSVNLLSP